jgi:hypothetical protein
LSGVVKPITFIPSLFLFYLCLLPFLHKPVYYLPFLCYVIMTVSFALYQTLRSGRPRGAALLVAVIPLFHICYGLGMVCGLASPKNRNCAVASSSVTIRKVKEFGRELEPGAGGWSL